MRRDDCLLCCILCARVSIKNKILTHRNGARFFGLFKRRKRKKSKLKISLKQEIETETHLMCVQALALLFCASGSYIPPVDNRTIAKNHQTNPNRFILILCERCAAAAVSFVG